MTLLKQTAICTTLASLLVGCATPALPTPAPTELVPPSYQHASAASENNVPRQWWRLYHDATLNELVETTLRDNPYTQVAHLRQIAAEAQTRLAGADRLPQLNTGVGFSNSRTSTNTALGQILGHQTISGDKITAGFDAAWQVDVWNRVGYAVAAAKAGEEAEQAFTRMIEQTLSWEVAVSYWQYRLAESDLELLTDIRQQRAEAESVLTGRFNAGLISELDLARARLESRNAEADIEDAKQRMSLAEHELATLTVKPVAQFSVPRDPAYRLPEVPAISPGLPASILRHRPDLAQSAQNIRALLAQKEIADTAFYPSISLTGNFGFASLDLRNLTNSDSRQFSLGPIAISLPILDGGRIRANQTIADARYREALNVHKVQLLIALREVDDALTEAESCRNQAALLQAARDSAQRVSLLAHARYDKGAVNYLEVAQADRDLAAAEFKLQHNHLKGLQASTQLIYVLGGG
jgi:multidrug efflux system outer membrane protein